MTRMVAAIMAGALLQACSPVNQSRNADMASLRPSDPARARLYDQSCKACHAAPGSMAPQVQDQRAWDARWAQGEVMLLNHTIQGYRAMPAGGQCATCTVDDYRALIRFMAGRDGKR